MSEPSNFYQILNVSPQAGRYDIRRAYRKLALLYHPDRVSPEQKTEAQKAFRIIVEAFFVLSHRERRKMYDQKLIVDQSLQSDKWSFVEVQVNAYSPEAFDYFYHAELADCSAFKIDGREFWGGTTAKVLAGIFFLLFFFLGQDVVPFVSIEAAGVRWSIPAILAVLYIILESVRDFVWDHVADDEAIDIALLGVCWLILVSFTVMAFIKAWNYTTPASNEHLPVKIEEKKSLKTSYPVNLEIFNKPIDPYSTNSIRQNGQI